jgi:glycosyltransferase involved in cell wall biosynthesis
MGKIAVVPNGFDIRRIREKSQLPLPSGMRNLLNRRYPVLVSVGRIAPMKGQDVLIEAVGKLGRDYPSLLCLIVGGRGDSQSVENVVGFHERLIRQIHRFGLQGKVLIIDETDCVPELLRSADVYVHPSFTESFSRVVVEALICGKPVVCTHAGALPEVVGPGGAFLVPPGDSEALACGVHRVLTEASLRHGIVSSGQAHVEKNYPVSLTTQKLLDVLRTAVGNGALGRGN